MGVERNIYTNETITASDTFDINIGSNDLIEFYGSAASGTPGSFSLQRSIDGQNYYTTDTIIVNPGTDIYGQFYMACTYLRILWNDSFGGVNLNYAAIKLNTL